METKRIYIKDAEHVRDEELLEAAEIIRRGGLVAFPTETVYGLGGNALDEDAAKKIYAAKGRPSDNPLIAHVSCPEEVEPLVEYMPEAGKKLMEAFWPGPLTMIFPKSSRVPYGTTGGLETVAVRMPSDPVANRLIALAGVPIAAPSANTSGRPSPTTADHVWQDMNGRIDMIIDGGPVGIGVVTIDPAILGPMAEGVRPKAPGMKYKHYAPKAELTLVEPAMEDKKASMTQEQVERMVSMVWKLAKEQIDAGVRVGIICTDESRAAYPEGIVRSIGARKSQESVAHNLYGVLREFDDLKAEVIFSESFGEDHLGQAIMNRLSKAAGYKIVRV